MRKDGTLRVTVKTPGAGKMLLEALVKKSRLAVASKGRAHSEAPAGRVTLTLRPTGKAKRTLRRAGKLAVTLRLTFTPTGGKAAKPLTQEGDAALHQTS